MKNILTFLFFIAVSATQAESISVNIPTQKSIAPTHVASIDTTEDEMAYGCIIFNEKGDAEGVNWMNKKGIHKIYGEYECLEFEELNADNKSTPLFTDKNGNGFSDFFELF